MVNVMATVQLVNRIQAAYALEVGVAVGEDGVQYPTAEYGMTDRVLSLAGLFTELCEDGSYILRTENSEEDASDTEE